MILHIIRHAESLANIGKSTVIDCELSDLGATQVLHVARALQQIGIDRVLSSPYRRALNTANGIATEANVPIEIMIGLHEHHPAAFPTEWPLLSRVEMAAHHPKVELADDFLDRDWHQPPESEQAAIERMSRTLDAIILKYGATATRLVAVTHGSPAGKLVQAFLGATDPVRAEVVIANASITTLEILGTKRFLRGVNMTDHLSTASSVPPPATLVQPVLL